MLFEYRIEHLRPGALYAFAPVILGHYQPRLLLLTTPSYTFNARFHAPGSPRPGGFADPTGRTDRIFRHSDHQFEWTPTEFREWLDETAARWGYTVDEFGGVGKPQELDPFGRDDELGCATQVAVLRRDEDGAAAMRRQSALERWRSGSATKSGAPVPVPAEVPHDLQVVHKHIQHSRTGAPLPVPSIAALVSETMVRYHTPEITIRALWNTPRISIACGGYLHVLVESIAQNGAEAGLKTTNVDDPMRLHWVISCESVIVRDEGEVAQEDSLSDDFNEEFKEGSEDDRYEHDHTFEYGDETPRVEDEPGQGWGNNSSWHRPYEGWSHSQWGDLEVSATGGWGAASTSWA